jgi:putative flippase GtrA
MSSSFLRFAAVGVVNTVIDVAILKLLTLAGMAVWAAAAIGYACGWTNGFFLSSKYVFKKKGTVTRYAKYALVAFGGLLLTELVIDLLHVRYFHIDLILSKLVAVALVFCWNYGLSKVWAFS